MEWFFVIIHERICMGGWTSTGEQGYPMTYNAGSGCGSKGWNKMYKTRANGFCCHK